MFSVGDLIQRKRGDRVERAVVIKVRNSGHAMHQGRQVALSADRTLVTAQVAVVDGARVLKTRATRTFIADERDGVWKNHGQYMLTDRQNALCRAYDTLVEQDGHFDKSAGGNGAHYIAPLDNVFAKEGMKCANCVAYEGGRGCKWVQGDIDPNAVCKLWIIAEPLIGAGDVPVLISEEALGIEKADSYSPPTAVRNAAKRAVAWIEEGKAGQGFTAVGAGRARDLAAGRSVSLDTVKRIANYLSRHEVDKKGKGFSQGEKEFPSAGRVAWDAWGGDAAKSWTAKILASVEKARTLEEGQFVRWKSSGGDAQGRIEHVMREGVLGIPESSFKIKAEPDDPAVLIRIYKKGADGWKETPTLVGHKASTLSVIEPLVKMTQFLKQASEERFTLAPWYIPDKYDAQNEWTDAVELQKALWDYVRSGDRDIRLQHNRDIKAGEWVEAMTLPHEWTTPVKKASGEDGSITYPAGTVLLGVVWEPWAWDMVKKGQITGFSIGGSAERIDLEIPQ